MPTILAAGTGAMVAVVVHSCGVVALGSLACAALVAVDVARGGDGRKLAALRDARTAAASEAIASARRELEAALGDHDRASGCDVAALVAPVADLEARATSLARRADEIAMHLEKANAAAVSREIDDLETAIRAAGDATVRAHYAVARDAHAEHLRTLAELARAKERIDATLVSIAATLEALPAKVVRLRTLEASGADATRDVGRDLAG